MRPLNTRDRRIQFTRFLLLFLLAVLPIVVLVWLHGRVDHAENDFLRKQYVRLNVEGEATAEHTALANALLNDAEAFKTYVNKNSGSLEKLKGEHKGEIDELLSAMGKSYKAMNQKLKVVSPSDSALLAISDHYQTTAGVFAKVYSKSCDGDEFCRQALEEAATKFKEKENELEKCQTSLRVYSNIP